MAEHQNNDNTKKLRELIKDIKYAMLTTTEDDGTLRSRPMATLQTEFDGDLWFFTGADAVQSVVYPRFRRSQSRTAKS